MSEAIHGFKQHHQPWLFTTQYRHTTKSVPTTYVRSHSGTISYREPEHYLGVRHWMWCSRDHQDHPQPTVTSASSSSFQLMPTLTGYRSTQVGARLLIQLPANVLGKAEEDGSSAGSLLTTRETRQKLAIWAVNQLMEDPSVSPSFPLYGSAFQTNKQKNV